MGAREQTLVGGFRAKAVIRDFCITPRQGIFHIEVVKTQSLSRPFKLAYQYAHVL